jgi:hypothetical protein
MLHKWLALAGGLDRLLMSLLGAPQPAKETPATRAGEFEEDRSEEVGAALGAARSPRVNSA